ncbi:hypothetical protein BHF71_10025 [Vulcanibacillus modesticaldus]|uniref:Uncharacterized protein n=1 Tax=Vulcanibacillus modesticaldus TaxID=337097 RepID=A0A1D2YTY1_9BACI|nr:hypothetical protein [Vulcanibacillus modesticaldus]OEF99162.1 hypothetical protein BHF71_10025 [Vulcanibacillus modesticaldus]
MNKKILVFFVFILLLGVFIFSSYTKQTDIENEYNGIIYSLDSNFEKKTSILLKGKLYKSSLGKGKFVGEIIVDNDISHDLYMEEERNKSYFGVITSVNGGYTKTIGTVFISSDFNSIWGNFEKIDKRYNISSYIAGPAKNKEEGNKIAQEIMQR